MITPVWIVGFSGHRHLSQPLLVANVLRQALESLQAQAKKQGGTIEFYSSAAYGADTLAAETAHTLGIAVHIILPMPEEEFRADFANEDKTFRTDDWQRAQALLANAREGKNGGTLRLARGSHLRPECYYDTGLQMLEASDLLLTLFDGLAAKGLGGTEEIVEQAGKLGKPVITIDPVTAVLSPGLEMFPPLSMDGIEIISELRHQRTTHQALASTADELFDQLNTIAKVEAKKFRLSLVASILYHGLAALIAAIALLFDVEKSATTLVSLAAIEFVLVFTAWFSTHRNHKRHTHERWLRARFAAELIRSIRPAIGFLDPLNPGIGRHAPKWQRFAMNASLLARRSMPLAATWQQRRDDYLVNRLDDQIAFFRTKQKAAAFWYHFTVGTGRWAEILAPWFVGAALTVKLGHQAEQGLQSGHLHLAWVEALLQPPIAHWLLAIGPVQIVAFRLLPVALPLFAGIAKSLRTALDSARRTHRYAELAERLTVVSRGFANLKTETTVRRTVAATEEILLDELIEWKLAEEQNAGH